MYAVSIWYLSTLSEPTNLQLPHLRASTLWHLLQNPRNLALARVGQYETHPVIKTHTQLVT